jgi:hypothetical protein
MRLTAIAMSLVALAVAPARAELSAEELAKLAQSRATGKRSPG